MADCGNLVLSTVLDEVSYDDMLLFNGFGNIIYKTKYAGVDINLATGRVSADHLRSLNELRVKYQDISLEELCDSSVYNNRKIVAIIPKAFLLSDVVPKENFVVFNPYYSMFEVTDVKSGIVKFKICGHADNNENVNELLMQKSINDLKKIENIKTKPFDYMFKFILIDKSEPICKERIISHMKETLKKCLISSEAKECNMTKISGKRFYDEFYSILKHWDNYNYYQKKFFIMSMQAGSTYFYRNEFADVLRRRANINEALVSSLHEIGNTYRRLKHILKDNSVNIKEAIKLLEFIKTEEPLTISKICEYKINIV